MDTQPIEKQVQALRHFLNSNTYQEAEHIRSHITLNTLVNCILDSQFTVLSDQKPKFLQLFKSKVLDSVQQTQELEHHQSSTYELQKQQATRINLSNIVCPLKFIIQQNKIFLYNQNQWKSYLQLILKLILGKGYSFDLSSQKKYIFLKFFLENITSLKEKIDTPKKLAKSSSKNDLFNQQSTNNFLAAKIQNLKEVLSFISGLKSESIFRQIFRTCSSLQNYHLLFDLCFIFLCHSHVRKVGDSDQKVMENFLHQFCLHSTIDETNVEIYFKLLKNYTNLFFKDIGQSMINLLLKVSSIMFIKKINHQDGQQNPQQKRQIEKIKQKIIMIIGQFRKNQMSKISKNTSQSFANLKNFEYFFIANALMGKNFEENLSKRLEIEFSNKIMLKMFNTLNLASSILDSYHFFIYLSSALSFINCAIQKAKKYPPKVLRFGHIQSFFSINIISQCQVSVKLKIQNCRENVALFQVSFKNKRIQISQKLFDSKLIGFICSETVKNQTKRKESQHFADFETCQEFLLTYEKSKLTISSLKNVKNSLQPVKIFEIDKFQTVNSRLSIGSSQKSQSSGPKIEEIQKFNISSKAVKKDKTQAIEKVNLLDLVTNNLYKGQINAKSNQLRVYGIKMSKISLVEYPTDIVFFSSCYNIKYILEKVFSCMLNHFLTKKQQVDKSVEKRLVQATLKEFIMLLSKIQTQKSTLDNIIKILLAIFLEKFQVDCKDSQQRKNMFLWILQLLQMLETSFGRVYFDDSQSFLTIFFSSIMPCSFSLFIFTIEHFLENLEKFIAKSFQNSFQIIRKLTLQASLLVSDVKITKEDKNLLIQKMDMLFKLIRQNFANKVLQKDEKSILQTTVKLVIEILTLERYDNETHQKMRRFKLSYVLINFVRNTFQLIESDFDQRGSLGKLILKLSAHKVQDLRMVICQDEQYAKANIMDDMQIRIEDSFIFEGTTVDSLIEDIRQMSITDFMGSRHVHQLLKDKMAVFSSYLDLFYHVGNVFVLLIVCCQKKSSLESFIHYLDKIMKHFDPEIILPPSLFYSELITKPWLYFVRMFEKSIAEKNDQDIQKNAFPILQILGKYNFDLLNPATLIRIANCFVNHSLFLLSSPLSWKLQVRLNNLIESPWMVNLLEEISQKLYHFPKTRKTVSKNHSLLFCSGLY